MDRRLQLHEQFVQILGSRNVYFQPPEGYKMKYPCIVYTRNLIKTAYADNVPYAHNRSYTVTVIYSDPDSDLPDKIAALPMCHHDRPFVNDNLYHDVFTLYY